MFGMGMPEILLIMAIALIVLGPKKLPEIAKSLGKGIAEFKRATQDFKNNMEVDNDFKDAKETLQGLKKDVQQTVNATINRPVATDNNEEEEEAVSEEDLEHTFEEESVKNSFKEPSGEKSSEEANQEEEEKGPSKDA